MPLRFSGQETSLAVLDTTKQDRLLNDMLAKNLNFTILTEIKKEKYLGAVGPEVLMFYDGYEFTVEWDPSNPVTIVQFAGLIINTAQRKGVTEFAMRSKFGAPDLGNFAVTFSKIAWDSPSFSASGQHEVMSSTLKGTGNVLTFQRL